MISARMKHPFIVGTVVVGTAAALLAGFPILDVAVAALAGYVILRLGVAIFSALARPMPEPPPPGEMRKVKITFRCDVCGAEVRMTTAPTEDPEPPRHCLEDMRLVTPID